MGLNCALGAEQLRPCIGELARLSQSGVSAHPNKIMLKALADSFAEAFAEFLHQPVRQEIKGYADGETLDNE